MGSGVADRAVIISSSGLSGLVLGEGVAVCVRHGFDIGGFLAFLLTCKMLICVLENFIFFFRFQKNWFFPKKVCEHNFVLEKRLFFFDGFFFFFFCG